MGGTTGTSIMESYGNKRIITIDGNTGSGKSSVARRVASDLNTINDPWKSMNVGEFCRAGTAYALDNGLSSAEMGKELGELEMKIVDGGMQVGGVDFSYDKLHGDWVSGKVSEYSGNPIFLNPIENCVRDIILKAMGNFVIEGRNMGTELFSDVAKLKVYLTADFDERVKRRAEQYKEKKGSEWRDEEIIDVIYMMQKKDNDDYFRDKSALIIPQAVEWDWRKNRSKKYGYDLYVDTTSINKAASAEKIIAEYTRKISY